MTCGYRCQAPVCGNMKLAQRLGPDGKVMTLIETQEGLDGGWE
jgi:hypothetical protein